jgi:transcriptional regulator with XRE-family HTH domain
MQAANLTEYKTSRGLSLGELSESLDVSNSYLSMILSGQRSPSKKMAAKISKKTGIPVLNLLFPSQEGRP